MGNFFSALGDIATNESAYRNAIIAAVVLLFAASGELIAEKAGTINISLEAMMLAGAFAAAIGADITHSVWVGLLFAAVAGLIVVAVQANMSHRLPADQFVVGLVLNVLVLGLVGFLTSSINPKSNVVAPLRDPAALAHPAARARRCSTSHGCCTSSTRVVPFVWWLIYRTRWGLEVRAVGEDPNAADVSGLRRQQAAPPDDLPHRTLAGIGGGYFLFARSGRFEDSLIGGRGFIAIAAVIFGGWTLKGTVAGCVGVRPRRLVRADDPVARLQVDRLGVPGDGPQRRHDRRDGRVRHTRPPTGGAGPTVHPRAAVKAVLYDHSGGPEVLEYIDVAEPMPGAPWMSSSSVEACALNRLDLVQRDGWYQHARLHLPAHRRHGHRRHRRRRRRRRQRRRGR